MGSRLSEFASEAEVETRLHETRDMVMSDVYERDSRLGDVFGWSLGELRG